MTDIERLKAIRGKLLGFIDHHDVEAPTIEEFLKIVEELIYLKHNKMSVAVVRFAKHQTLPDGSKPEWNEMPKVISCNWLPDGEYKVYLSPENPTESLADYCKQAAETVREWPKWKRDGADVTKGGPL